MGQEEASGSNWVSRGEVEAHAGLLEAPLDDEQLYKVMSVEDFVRSVKGNYLHFTRVDTYRDFPDDGDQPPRDRGGNTTSKFQSAPGFSAADYYDQCRRRTYATCFSLEHSKHLWETFGKGGVHGKVCLVTSFGKLRSRLNMNFGEQARLQIGDDLLKQIFSINYGKVEYIGWDEHLEGQTHLPNPIRYAYLKDRRFSQERELRVSLSALGIGEFVSDRGVLTFPPSIQVDFNFKEAMMDGGVTFRVDPDFAPAFLISELKRSGIDVEVISGGAG